MEQLELSYTAGGNVKHDSCFWKQFGSFLKFKPYTYLGIYIQLICIYIQLIGIYPK